jgi:hypothetical protein
MLKAASLYVVILISLVIAVISSLLITAAGFYQAGVLQKLRYQKLLQNLQSASAIVLNEHGQFVERKTDLFGDERDSVAIARDSWGIYNRCTVKSFSASDTLKRTFFSGSKFESGGRCIVLADEDRPLSVSGDTRLIGNALLPKSGIRKAFAEGKAFTGDQLVNGTISSSSRQLPPLNETLIRTLTENFSKKPQKKFMQQGKNYVRSFYEPAEVLFLDPGNRVLSETRLDGHIEIHADTLVEISANCRLENAIIYAPAIRIEKGFSGSCQLFATDSIVTGDNCTFSYPSCIGVLKEEDGKFQPKIALGAKNSFSGALFIWEKKRSSLQTLLSLGKNTEVSGELYAAGLVKFERPVMVKGMVSCHRFIMKTAVTMYENYLIDIFISRTALSKYYLSSPVFDNGWEEQEEYVLKWLN